MTLAQNLLRAKTIRALATIDAYDDATIETIDYADFPLPPYDYDAGTRGDCGNLCIALASDAVS